MDTAPYEARLRARLSDLEARLTRAEAELDEVPNPDAEERATEREGDEVLEGLGNAGLQEIRMIRAALDRIEQGTYGVCAECGEDIPERRLDAVPHASRCARCA